MSMPAAIRQILLQDDTVVATMGSAIYTGEPGDAAPSPYMRVIDLLNQPMEDLGGHNGLIPGRFRLDLFGDTGGDLEEVTKHIALDLLPVTKAQIGDVMIEQIHSISWLELQESNEYYRFMLEGRIYYRRIPQ